MAIGLSSAPSVVIGVDPLQGTSLYNAVHNPIIWNFNRYDFLIDHIVISGSGTQVDIYPTTSDANFTGISSGPVFVSNATLGNGLFGLILNGTTYIRLSLDGSFVDGTYTNGGYIISPVIKGYRVEVQIGMMDSGTFTPLVTSSWVPAVDGSLQVDVAEYLKPLLPIENDINYTALNFADLNLSKIYAIKYREVWIGNEGESFSAASSNSYVTNSAKQIGDLYGGNMGEFVPFDVDMVASQKAKFLSGFVTPHYWTIAPFDLAFIYGNVLSGTVVRNFQARDINGTAGLSSNTNLLTTERYYINRMTLSDLTLTSYYADIQLSYSSHAITETKRIKLENDCTKHPVYLCWKSKNGAWDYWLFDWNQTFKRNIGDLKQYENYLTDFANATARIKASSKTSVPSMMLGASNIPVEDVFYNEQFPGLTGLLDSPEVLMLMNLSTWVADGAPKWRTVIPKVGTFKVLETKDRFSSVEFEISLPYLQIESQ